LSRTEETNKQTNKVIGITLWDLSKAKTVFHFSGQKQVGPKSIPIGWDSPQLVRSQEQVPLKHRS